MTGKYKNTPTTWKNIPLLMDINYAALLLSKTPENVNKLCQNGTIPAKKVGNEWRIEKSQLMIFLGISKDIALRQTGLYTGEPA